jgi:hypothetical protein
VARRGWATQADTNNWVIATPPGRAIDGNRDGNHEAGSVAMTYRVSDAWWEVDLGGVYDIDHITLWNRTDCCSDRLHDYYVFVSDEPFEVKDIENTLTQVGVMAIFQSAAAGRSVEVPVERSGRYVRVQLAYVDAVLQLAEVEVMVGSASLSLEASISGDPADSAPGPVIQAGSPIPMSFEVTNTGADDLWSIWVNAPGFGTAACPQRNVAPGATVTCTLSTTASPGSFSSTARVVGYDSAGNEVEAYDPIHVFVPSSAGAAVRLDVLVDGLNGDVSAGPRIASGEIMTFTYLVSNEGATALTGVAVRDTAHGAISCPRTTVAPGQTMVCVLREMATVRVTFLDATVTARSGTRSLTDTERLYYHVRPEGREDDLILDVTIDGVSASTAPGPVFEVGRTVRVRYVLTNNSNAVAMWSAEVIDPRVPANRMSCLGGPTLANFQSMICTATMVIQAGNWSNVVVGHAWSSNGPRIDASDRVYYTGIL